MPDQGYEGKQKDQLCKCEDGVPRKVSATFAQRHEHGVAGTTKGRAETARQEQDKKERVMQREEMRRYYGKKDGDEYRDYRGGKSRDPQCSRE